MQRVGPYIVERELARGGQGVVLLGRDARDGRAVAIKLLLEPWDEVSARRFEREARALGSVSHPSLVRVVEHGVEQGRPYLAMELIDGEDLGTRLARGGPLPAAVAARLLAPVARALEACHAKGIIHRDVKPHNILVERGTERPVLVDFGLVRRDPRLASQDGESRRLSLTGEVMGTPSFMPPEQVNAGGVGVGPVGPPADVHALGATLYALLTGQPPFNGATTIEVLTKVLDRVPASPRSLVPSIPAALDALCMRALHKQPGARPTVAAFAADLEAFAAAPRQRRSSRRTPARAGGWALAIVAVVAVGGAAAALFVASRSTPVLTPVPTPIAAAVDPTPWPAPAASWRVAWRRGAPGALAEAPVLWSDADTAAPLEAVARGDPVALAAAFDGAAETRAHGRVAVRYAASALRARVDTASFLTTVEPVGPCVEPGPDDRIRLRSPNDTGAPQIDVGAARWRAPRLRFGLREVKVRAPGDVRQVSMDLVGPEGAVPALISISGRRRVIATRGGEVPFALGEVPTWVTFAPWAPPGERVRVGDAPVEALDRFATEGDGGTDLAIRLVLGEVELELLDLEVEGAPGRVDRPALAHVASLEPLAARLAGAFEREASACAGPTLVLGDASVELAGSRLLLRSGDDLLGVAGVDAAADAPGWLTLERRPGLLLAEVEVAGRRHTLAAADPFGRAGAPGWGSTGPRVRWVDVELATPATPAVESVGLDAWRAAARGLARLTCPRRCDPSLAGRTLEAASARLALAQRSAVALERAADDMTEARLRVDALARALLAWVLGGDAPAALRVLERLRRELAADATAAVDGLLRDPTGAPVTVTRLARGWLTVARDREPRTAALLVAWNLAPGRRSETAVALAVDARATGRQAEGLTWVARAREAGATREAVAETEAICLLELGRYAEALSAYDVAVIAGPTLGWCWEGRARALDALGRLDEAIESGLGAFACGRNQATYRLVDDLLRRAPVSPMALVGRALLSGVTPELRGVAARLQPTAQGRDADLLAYLLGVPPPEGDRPTRVLAEARAGDPAARLRLAEIGRTEPFVRHVVILDPRLSGP